jgi:hypothetical protein
MPEPIPHVELIAPSAAPEEAAAIVAALERFMRATAAGPERPSTASEEWLRAAILEGVSREREGGLRDPWINT